MTAPRRCRSVKFLTADSQLLKSQRRCRKFVNGCPVSRNRQYTRDVRQCRRVPKTEPSTQFLATSALGREGPVIFWTPAIQLSNISCRQQRAVNVSNEGVAFTG
jgi:hypothetical protein